MTGATEETKSEQKNLIRKLAEIMNTIERIPKRGHNDFHNYDYALESDIKDVVRKEMSARKILMLSNELSRKITTVTTKKGGQEQLVTLEVEFTLTDADSCESVKFVGYGDGQDSGDKAVYKAKTGALKYALTSLFLIPTGKDPENEGQSLQPKYIDQGKIEYLDKLVKQVATVFNTSSPAVVAELKRSLNTDLSFEKFEVPLFEEATRLLIQWNKQHQVQATKEAKQTPNFGGTQGDNNQSNYFQWGAQQ